MTVPARAVALSLFPDILPDRPVGQILGSVFVGTNAELMTAVAPFYLDGHVVDVTFGWGGWWTLWRPEQFTCHDLFKLDGVDYTALPELDGSVDAVCFDPPYIPQGGYDTSTQKDFADRYGLQSMSRAGLRAQNEAGLTECARITRAGGFVLVKCNDFVNGGGFHLGHRWVMDHGETCGLAVHDLIIHHTGSGPGGHNIFTPVRARRHHSYLVVFKKAA